MSRPNRSSNIRRCQKLGRHHWRPITTTTLMDELTHGAYFAGAGVRKYLRTCTRCGVRQWVTDNRTYR